MACGFCESALANSVGTLLVDWVAQPIGNQLNYICRFHNNVKMLMERKDELVAARARLKHEIDDAEGELQEKEDDVRGLLSKMDKTLSDIETLETEMQQNKRCFSWCPNWCWRYGLSKKAMKNTHAICELLKKSKEVSQPGRVGYRSTSTIPTIEFLSSKDFMVSKSSNMAFTQIIEALKDDNVSMIGLWGMAGVGKTTLVVEVGKQAKQLNLFDKVVITTVSQKPNFETIQDEIAKYVGFSMKNERGRRSTQELWLRLQREKRILIILDDVWAKIDLKEKIGIPLAEDHKGCKILLTTRRQRVCGAMECRKAIPLGCLDEDEAWTLFAKKAGVDDSSGDAIKDVAAKVARRCKGLPIAIVTLGSALKGRNGHGWKAAYRRLEKRRLLDIEDIDEQNAYLCLEVSFDYLKDRETKMCFLLCSLFPEDYEISVEDLVRYAWGIGLYEGMDSIEDARSDVLAAIDILKDSCLLLNCGEKRVKMHDMVRDVALWIASPKKEFPFVIKSDVEMWPKDESLEPYEAISFHASRIVELPKGLVCPKLKILLLLGDGGSIITPSEFFKEMEALKVCALRSRSISLDAFQFQKNLQTLDLKDCQLLDISVIGKMKKLEVLSFSGSDIIELPEEIGDLNNLKLLDLSYCGELQRIPPQLIQRLSKLEVLYLHGYGLIKWVTDNTIQEESCASLSELNSLSKLTALSVEVSSKHLSRGFVFRKLKRFYVCVYEGDVGPINDVGWFDQNHLEICTLSAYESCKQLIGDTESLNLKYVVGCQNLVPSLEWDHVVFNKLTSLCLESCEHMKCLIDTTKQQGFLVKLKTLSIRKCEEMISGIPILQNLEELAVEDCGKMQVLFQVAQLRSIEEGPSHHVSLKSLKVVRIYSCNKLRYLFPTSVAKSLGQLETLRIEYCSELEEIIPQIEASNISCNQLRSTEEGPSNHVSLKSLKAVYINRCNQLRYLFPTSVAKSLGQLETLTIDDCPELEEIIPQMEASNISCNQLRSIEEGASHHVSLKSLKVVQILTCNKLRYLFPTSVAKSLGQLETLMLVDCPELEEIIPQMEASNISLQRLREVSVGGCNNLASLSSLSHGQSLENLTYLSIRGCSRLEYTFPISMAEGLPQLNVVDLENLPRLKGRDGYDVVLTLPSLKRLNVVNCPQLTPFIISAKIEKLRFGGMTEEKQTTSNMMVPELRDTASSMGYLRITNFEELFDAPYNLSSLKQLWLAELPELRVLWKGPIQVENFQNLTELGVDNCKRLRYVLSPTIARNLPQLSYLKAFDCEELEQIIGKDDQTSSQDHHLQPIFFPNLTEIFIRGCGNLKSLFPISVAHGLPKLKELCVVRVPKLEQVFEEGGEPNEGEVIQLPQLGLLGLDGLASLVSFIPVGYHFVFPSLRYLHVKDCPNIRTSFRVDDARQTGHAETEAGPSIDKSIVKLEDGNDISAEQEESATVQETTWPIGSDLSWCKPGFDAVIVF